MQKLSAKEKLTRARIMLIRKQPFFGTLAIQLELVEDKVHCPTLMTDGKRIYFNPDYVDTLPIDILPSALAHEVMHNVCLHLTRRGKDRDPGRWNRAGDFVINAILKECGMPLSEGWLYADKYVGHNTDQVYNMLKSEEGDDKNKDSSSGGGGAGGASPQYKPGCGWYKECDHDHGEHEAKEMEQDMKRMLASASASMAGVGKLPGALRSMIDQILYKPQDWRQVLRHFIEESTRDNYNWMSPNRRYLGRGVVLPSLNSKRIKPFVIAFDISGSVDDELVKNFIGAVNDLMMEIRPESVELVQCDTKIQKTETYMPEDMPIRSFEIAGRGGTDFKPVFDWITKEGIDPSGLIYFTDMAVGQSEFPKGGADYPVIWVVPENADAKTAPFGTTVKMF